MGPDPIEAWPPILQALIYLGGGVAMIAMWIFGGRNGKKHEDRDDATRELNEAIRKLDRAETKSDIERLRADMERVLGAMREAILNKIDAGQDALYERVSKLEQAVARIEGGFKHRSQ